MTTAIRSSIIIWRLVVAAGSIWLLSSAAAAQTPSGAQVQAEVEAGAYDRAEKLARDRVLALTLRLGQGAAEVRASEQLLVETLILNGRGAQRSTLDLARRVAQRTPDGRPPSVQSLIDLGDALVAAAEYTEAITILTPALSALPSPNSDPDSRAAVQCHLGRALIYDGRPAEALPMLERCLAYRRDQGDAGRLADALLSVAWGHQRTGNYGAAGAALREALAIRESTPDHPGYADVLSLFGLQLWFEGNLMAARATSAHAVAVAERTLRPEHPVVALALMRLGATVLDLGDVAESLAIKQRALTIAEQSFGPAHYETWAYLNGLAESRRRNGEYIDARALYLRALAIAEGRFGATHDSVATTVHNLALVDASLGDYTRARSEQARATSTWERLLGPNHPFVAVALTELAAVYRAQGEAAEALPMLRRSLRIRTQQLGRTHRDVAMTLSDLAATYLDLGRLTEAEQAIRQALEIWDTTAGPETPDLAVMCDLRARIHARRGQLADAQVYYERALTIWDAALGRLHPSYARAQAELAMVLARLGRLETASTAAAEAEDAGRTHLRLMLRSLPERQALSYTATRPSGLGLLLSLASVSPSAAGLGYDRLVRSRALVLDEMAFRRGTADMSAEARDLYARLTLLRRRLANLVVDGAATVSLPQFPALLEATQRDIESLETELASRSAPFRMELGADRVGFSDLRARLGAGEVLVSFVKYERSAFDPPSGQASARVPFTSAAWYVAFVVTSTASEPITIPLASADRVEALVAQWRSQLLAETSTAERGAAAPDSRALGAQLRRMIWDPVSKQFAGARWVFVVPDGALSLVPLAALPSGPGRYLIDDGPLIHVLTAERDLLADEMRPRSVNKGLLAIGGPSFSARTGGTLLASSKTGPSAPDIRRGGSSRDDCGYRSMRFEPLPGSRAEAEQTQALWTGLHPSERESSELLVGASATEQAFKQLSAGHRVLHIATHGFFLDGSCEPASPGTRAVGGLVTSAAPGSVRRPKMSSENPLLLSGLALAGANRRSHTASDEDDGILTAEEVASLDLRGVEWAVLSACDTGLGTITAGEGVIGLRRAFQIAGVKTIMMSLWPVGDQTARQWTELLYRARVSDGLDSASSAWQATKQLLDRRRTQRQSTNPFYWAGFVAAGDWH